MAGKQGGRIKHQSVQHNDSRIAAIPLPRSLTRYARSFGCGERRAYARRGKVIRAMRKRHSRFSIGFAPLTSITKSDTQISGGETRQDYKDTRRFPLMAPSCALLFLPFGLPVSFRCYGRVCLIPRLTLQFRVGSSLQAGLYARTPFSPTPRQTSNSTLESNLV